MSLWEDCQKLQNEGTSYVIVTMAQSRGSAPQEPGAKMLVTMEGHHSGTIGGGKVEMAAIKKSQELLQTEKSAPLLVTWNLQKDIGMSCGGEVTFLFEHFPQTNWPIVIFGAGHVCQALTRILVTINSNITVIDSRQDWLEKLTAVKTIHHVEPKEVVKTFNPKSFFLCMTMGHSFDVPILREIANFAPECPYIGVIGSEVKGIKIKKELKEFGVAEAFLEKLRVPMGLPIGNNQPSEIAISITAELLQVRDHIK